MLRTKYCRAFDLFAAAHSACGLPVYVSRVLGGPFCEMPWRLTQTPSSFRICRSACPQLPTPVNSAYGRTGNAAEAKPRLAASSVAAAATEPAHSSDALARAAQPGSTGDGNKSRVGRVAGGCRCQRAQ